MRYARGLTVSTIVTAAMLSGLSACDHTTGPAAAARIVSGDNITDTVGAVLITPLGVQVVDSRGDPVAGVEIQFIPPTVSGITPADPRIHTWVRNYSDTTDAGGMVRAGVTLGEYAGPDSIIVRIPSIDQELIARYTVRPGANVGVAVFPTDTAVYVGHAFRLRGSTVDRWGNPRGEPVTYSATSEVEIRGDSLFGRTFGRATITAASGGHTGVGWVSVVPNGRIAAVLSRYLGSDTLRLVLFNLDGSGKRSFDLPYWTDPEPDWAASGDTLVMRDAGTFPGDDAHLVVVDTSGSRRRLIDSTAGFVSEYYPQFSVDGSWIYFTGRLPGLRGDIWRVHLDGSGLARVGPPSDYYDGDLQPSPSPDGSRLAFTRTPDCCYDLLVRVLHIATGAIDTLQRSNGTPINGLRPRWSPTADVIAYHNAGQIWLMQPDASNERTASPPGHAYGAFDWSPDGQWLIAESDADLLYLIKPATGLALPLPFTRALRQPAWHP